MKFKKSVSKGIITVLMMSAMMSVSALSSSYANDVDRVSGSDRYDTSVELSKRVYKSADKAVLVSGENFADALCAGVLSGQAKSPLLLSQESRVSGNVLNELKRLGVKEVVIVGGDNSISKSVENVLSKSYKVQRVSGADRYKTSVELAKYLKENYKVESIGVANGAIYADALAATPYLNMNKGALILSNGENIDSEAESLVKGLPMTVFGGSKSVSDSLVNKYKAVRIAGANRFETALSIAKKVDPQNRNFILVNGEKFPDALSSASLAYSMNAPIVFDNADTIKHIKENSSSKVIIVGGENSVGKSVSDSINGKSEEGSKAENSVASSSSSRHHSSGGSYINPNKKVVFEDLAVRKEVNSQLARPKNLFDESKAIDKKLKDTYEPTVGDMRNIKNLDISYLADADFNPIVPKSLKGLEEAVNVESVKLNGLEFHENLDFLKNFRNMKSLSMASDKISDPSFVKDLTKLEKLDLSRNQISDISSLSKLTNLKELILNDNKIESMDAVRNMPELQDLTIYNNKISDIAPVENLVKLKKLELSGNQIRSIEKIGKKPALEQLYFTGDYTKPFETPKMTGNYFSDISPLASMTNLKILYLQDLRLIEDLRPLENLTNLETLTVRNNKVKDVTPLRNLTHLKMLHLYKNQVEDISSLNNLVNLEEFNFAVNKVKDMSVVENMPKLSFLMAYSNDITDISPASKLTKLTAFNAHRNHVSDFSSIKTLLENSPEAGVVMDNEELNFTEKAINTEVKNDTVELTVKNPIKGIDGNPFMDIATSGPIQIEDDTTNEMKAFYEVYNEAINKLNEDGIKIVAKEDNIVVSIPKDKYIDGDNELKIPFYKMEENAGFAPIGGVIDLTIQK